jgi:DNA modification methylase
VIHTGDSLEVMATFEPESIDAIVTDPPYGLEFMGKKWDKLATPKRSDPCGSDALRPWWCVTHDAPWPAGTPRCTGLRVCANCGAEEHPETLHYFDRRDGAGFHAPKDEGRTFTNESGHMYDNLKSLPRFGKDSRAMQDWHEAWAREAFRIAKPGAHLLAFGGTRTYHRLASAIEDAGWEIRDTLVWAYASGFPKSLDVSKAIDKMAGAEREVVGPSLRHGGGRDDAYMGMTADTAHGVTAPATPDTEKWNGWGTALKPAWEPIVMARKPLRGTVAANVLRHGTGALNIDGTRIGYVSEADKDSAAALQALRTKHPGGAPTYGGGNGMPAPTEVGVNAAGRWPANVILTDPIFDGGVDGVVGGGETTSGKMLPTVPNATRTVFGQDAAAGYETMETYGDTGTYSRFFLIPKSARSEREPVLGGLPEQHAGIAIRQAEPGVYEEFVHPAPEGIGAWLRDHREAAGLSAKELCGLIGAHGAVNHGGAVSNWEQELNRPTPEQWRSLRAALGFDDRYDGVMTTTRTVPRQLMDGATPARRQNNHPTVKPLDLMRHLVRLVTPPGGTCLDPFLGSGTTALAAEMEGFAWIGIEKEAEYVAIAEARLNGTQRGLGLDVGAPTPRNPNTHPDLSKHQPKRRAPGENYSGGWTGTEDDVA